MKNLFTSILSLFLWVSICLTGLSLQSAHAEDFVGSVVGDITGYVTDGNGNQISPQAAVSADIDVSIDDTTGNITANVNGSAACTGGLGVFFEFAGTYDSATGALAATVTDNTGTAAQSVTFQNQGGTNWTANISGTSPSSTGPRPYNLNVDLTLPVTALYSGSSFPSGTQFGGPLDSTFNASIPLSIPQAGINETVQVTLEIKGTWQASVVPLTDGSASLTGSVKGTFNSKDPVSLTVTTLGSQSISVPIQGTFGGTLISNDISSGSVEFAGNWTETGGSTSFGGDMKFNLPIGSDGSISSFNVSIDGAQSLDVMGLSITIPYQISGTIPVVFN